MKKRSFVRLTIMVILLALTLLGTVSELRLHLFTGGSTLSTTTILGPDLLTSFGLLIAAFIGLWFFKKKSWLSWLLVSSIIALWFLSGRTLGMGHITGKLTSGWFFIPTHSFYLCSESTSEECLENVKVDSNIFFSEIRTEEGKKTVFTGPFLKPKLVNWPSESSVSY
ncbi:hypothetical protein [Croceimicrobium sp.]|uniref:hypothetical protein n=1 Tax=Croceimicrobium sp. TaxID=2828340 RepID=UPI003BAD6679